MVTAIKRVEFVSDGMSCLVLRGRWCNIIVLNMHEPSGEKSGDSITLSAQYRRIPKKGFVLTFMEKTCN